MSQQCLPNQARLNLPLQFPPIPLASGDLLIDDQAREHLIIRMTVTVYTDCGDDPVEIDLDAHLGGWWAPADLHVPADVIHAG